MTRIHSDRLMSRFIDFEPDGGEGGEGGGAGGDDKKFTQADLDRIVQDRLARDRKDRPSDDEIQQLRDKAKKLDEMEASNKTELEKLTERVEAAEKRANDAEAARQQAEKTAKDTKLQAQLVAEAAKKNVVDPDAAVKLLDTSKIEFDDNDNPKNIAEAMDALLTEKPYLLGGGGNYNGGNGNGANGAADQGARGGNGAQLKSTDGMSSEEIAKAATEGRLDEYLKTPTP